MAFTDFTSPNKVKEYFSELIISSKNFIPDKVQHFEPSPDLADEIMFNLKSYKPSEAYANNFLIAPIINSVWRKHEQLNVWAQRFIKADEKLNGRPDYLISPLNQEQYTVLSLPIVVIVEAKHENFISGWGQCLAGMVACQKINKSDAITIFGIVTTGQYWEFGKLEGNKFIKNINSFNLSSITPTINIVNHIFEQAEKEIPRIDTSVIVGDEDNNDV